MDTKMLTATDELDYPKKFRIPLDWEYRGEGNLHVVLSLPKLKKVLRIKKVNKPRSFFEWIVHFILNLVASYWGSGINEEHVHLLVYSKVIRSLFGYNYVSEAKQVLLSWKHMKYIEKKLVNCRPDFRKHKILKYDRATLFNDFTYLSENQLSYTLSKNTFSIEIKPKQAWFPFSEKHYSKCFFCLNQDLKLNSGSVKQRSKYCPEDLFSGEPKRMKEAIEALIESPQNNFRIFKNGKLCFGEKNSEDSFIEISRELFMNYKASDYELKNSFCDLMVSSLLTNFESKLTERCKAQLFCKWDSIIQNSMQKNLLPKGCVLEKILSSQMLNVEGNQYYAKLMNDNINDWKYVQMMLEELSKYKGICMKCAILMMSNAENVKEKPDLMFVPYLISAIANDCSLMVSFGKILNDERNCFGFENVIKCEMGTFLVNVGIIDLYPKPMSTIRKQEARNKKFLEISKKYI